MKKVFLCTIAFDDTNDWIDGGLGWYFDQHAVVISQGGNWQIFAYWTSTPSNNPNRDFNGCVLVEMTDYGALDNVFDTGFQVETKAEFIAQLQSTLVADLHPAMVNGLKKAGFDTAGHITLYDVVQDVIVG